MAGREDFLFWRLAYDFITDSGYRLVRLSESQNELWFENSKHKNARMIRLVRADIDWSNSVVQDKQMVAIQAEKLRKHLMARHMNVLNIYVTAFPPVDADREYLEEAISAENEKTNIHTILLTREDNQSAIRKIGDIIGHQSNFEVKDEYDEAEIHMMSQGVLKKAAAQQNEERQLFDFAKPFLVYVLMAIQVLVFIIMELNGGSTNPETLIKFGAKYNPLIIEGEWWRFITPVFLHIGILHLAMNTLALYYLGTAVERMYGHTRFLWIYLFSGFTGALASFVFSGNLSAGASGAIFGCFGALLYVGITYPKLFFRTMGTNVLLMIGINLVFGFSIPQIDNAGHIGGLIGGFLATGVFHFPKKRKYHIQVVFTVLLACATAGMLYFGFHQDRPDVVNAMVQEQIAQGEMEEAYETLRAYVTEGKGNAITLFHLSYLEIQLEKYDEAKEHLKNAIQSEPQFHEAHYNLALIYHMEGDIDNAKYHAEVAESISSQPEYEDFLNDLRE